VKDNIQIQYSYFNIYRRTERSWT